MKADPDLAAAAALLADPARAAMLARLMDGRSWTATELAKAAAIRPSTGSSHLAKLLDQGWVSVYPQGRHRYYRLSGESIASFLERFAGIAPEAGVRTPGEIRASAALRHCRVCYDHLAGQVGVAFAQALLERGWLDGGFRLTGPGLKGLETLGLSCSETNGRGCMDWSERRLHLAGPLGRTLTGAMVSAGWFQRDPHSRALWPTALGQAALMRDLGLVFSPSR
jgi:DNA-binding transcriptional ArsR family regulator